MRKPKQKWQLTVWRGKRHTPKLDAKGRETGTVRSNHLFRRDYDMESSANRAIPNLRRRFPDANIEWVRYELEGGFFWMQREVRVVQTAQMEGIK
jgi:hypothetical protein